MRVIGKEYFVECNIFNVIYQGIPGLANRDTTSRKKMLLGKPRGAKELTSTPWVERHVCNSDVTRRVSNFAPATRLNERRGE